MGGANNYGVIFSYNPGTATFTDLYDFNYNIGVFPVGCFVAASNGVLYGTASPGGLNHAGLIFSFNPNTNTYTGLFDFDGVTGQYPVSGLIQDSNGILYGTTGRGGVNDDGVIFSYNINTATCTKLFDFDTTTGIPISSLVPAGNGLLYGITYQGTIFSYNVNTSAYTNLFDFSSTISNNELGGLMLDSNGLLYGTTLFGGVNSAGIIYSYNPGASNYTVLVEFNSSPVGAFPYGSLVQADNGLLYGVTTGGGTNGSNGVIFSYSPGNNTYTTLFNLNDTSGAFPEGNLIQASNGLLYGMASTGGIHNDGVIFSYNINTAVYSVLFDFNDTIGAYPYGSLLQASNGVLYGMTNEGGTNGAGVIFSYNPNTAIYTDIYNFDGNLAAYPNGSLVEANNGLLYGMTSNGGRQ